MYGCVWCVNQPDPNGCQAALPNVQKQAPGVSCYAVYSNLRQPTANGEAGMAGAPTTSNNVQQRSLTKMHQINQGAPIGHSACDLGKVPRGGCSFNLCELDADKRRQHNATRAYSILKCLHELMRNMGTYLDSFQARLCLQSCEC